MGHVFSDMDRLFGESGGHHGSNGFNWATSFQTWIAAYWNFAFPSKVMFQLGHVFSDMDRKIEIPEWLWKERFQLGHVFSDMDRRLEEGTYEATPVSIGPRLFRHG